MALPPAAPERQLKHRRSINVQIFARGGGLWEVDAEIADVKTRDAKLAGGMRRAGDPIHDMLLRLIVDEQFNIVEAGSETRWMPYPGHCDDHGDAYAPQTAPLSEPPPCWIFAGSPLWSPAWKAGSI